MPREMCMRIPLMCIVTALALASPAYAHEPRMPTDKELADLTANAATLRAALTPEDREIIEKCQTSWHNEMTDKTKVIPECDERVSDTRRLIAAVRFCEHALATARAMRNPKSDITKARMRQLSWDVSRDPGICARRAKEYGPTAEPR